MRIVGVIPARIGSTRLPRKPLQKILERTLIEHVVLAVQKCKRLDALYVATDSEEICAAVTPLKVRTVMTDPHLPSGTDRVWAALQGENADLVLNIQGDEPLIQTSHLEALIDCFDGPQVAMASLSQDLSIEELMSKDVVKVICNQLGEAIYFSRFPIPYSRISGETEEKLICAKHIGLYGYRRDFLKTFCATSPSPLEKAESLEQLRALDLGAKIKIAHVKDSLHGVDTPADLLKVAEILKGRANAKK